MKPFNWSELTRNIIISYITSLENKLTRKKISILDLHKIVSRELKSKIPIKIKKKFNCKIIQHDVTVGGYYRCSDDQLNLKSINLVFTYHNRYDWIKIDKCQLINLGKVIADTILHEIIHMRQYRKRNFEYPNSFKSLSKNYKERKNQEYLGNLDEIDAYSFNIACDLLDQFNNNKNKVLNYLNNSKIYENQITLQMYLETFKYNHKVIKQLKNRIIKYIPNALEGKPYKNKDWIWY